MDQYLEGLERRISVLEEIVAALSGQLLAKKDIAEVAGLMRASREGDWQPLSRDMTGPVTPEAKADYERARSGGKKKGAAPAEASE